MCSSQLNRDQKKMGMVGTTRRFWLLAPPKPLIELSTLSRKKTNPPSNCASWASKGDCNGYQREQLERVGRQQQHSSARRHGAQRGQRFRSGHDGRCEALVQLDDTKDHRRDID